MAGGEFGPSRAGRHFARPTVGCRPRLFTLKPSGYRGETRTRDETRPGGSNQPSAAGDAEIPSLPIGSRLLTPNSEIERGARPPLALFSAPSRKTPAAGNCAQAWNPPLAENAGREGASSHARGGRAPRTSEFGFNPSGVVTVFAAGFSGLHPELFTFHPFGMVVPVSAKRFGLRWQSAAATPLLGREATLGKRRGAALPAALQNAARCRAGGRRSAGMSLPGRTAANCPAGYA